VEVDSAGTAPAEPDFSWLLPDLAVGGRLPPGVVEVLASRFGIRRVVDVRAEEQDDPELLRVGGVELLHLPTPDHHPVAQEMLWMGVRWIGEGLARGERVLIHCEHGIGRSILLACCVLVSRGHGPLAALELIKVVREKASPSPEQLHALLRWSSAWHQAKGTSCPPATWDDLARVAYRHLVQAAIEVGGP
jgi:hypothetical protein